MLTPDLTTRPAPLISGWTISVVGAAVLGTVIWAGLAPSTTTVGSPALGRTATPVAVFSGVLAETRSMKKRTVSVGPKPAWALPAAPKASAGGIAISNRDPTCWPVRPLVRPGNNVVDERSSGTVPL